MLNCKEASQLLSQSLDRELSWRERWSLRIHLMMCEFCRRFGQQIRLVRDMVRRQVGEMEQNGNIRLPDEARERIAKRIES